MKMKLKDRFVMAWSIPGLILWGLWLRLTGAKKDSPRWARWDAWSDRVFAKIELEEDEDDRQ